MKAIVPATLLIIILASCEGFGIHSKSLTSSRISIRAIHVPIFASQQGETKSSAEDGVIELVETEEEEPAAASSVPATEEKAVAPFLSQGEIQPETLKVDLNDPKQTRVIIYIILSLLPVLFLIPLMLGSREFLPAIIPMDDLPPVQM